MSAVIPLFLPLPRAYPSGAAGVHMSSGAVPGGCFPRGQKPVQFGPRFLIRSFGIFILAKIGISLFAPAATPAPFGISVKSFERAVP